MQGGGDGVEVASRGSRAPLIRRGDEMALRIKVVRPQVGKRWDENCYTWKSCAPQQGGEEGG